MDKGIFDTTDLEKTIEELNQAIYECGDCAKQGYFSNTTNCKYHFKLIIEKNTKLEERLRLKAEIEKVIDECEKLNSYPADKANHDLIRIKELKKRLFSNGK